MVIIPVKLALEIIAAIIKRLEYIFIFFGVVLLLGYISNLNSPPPKTIYTVAELEENISKYVIIDTTFEHSGYELKSTYGIQEEVYYIAQLEDSHVFLTIKFSDSYHLLNKNEGRILGFIKQSSLNDNFKKLQTSVCNDLGISLSEFEEIFTPYFISFNAEGDENIAIYGSSDWFILVISIGFILFGAAIILLKIKRS